ncbi:malate synthase A [Pantanalinema rosaneae CENA516]|uniref:malate synthase A n=1 Tax=Pantanalinema rosaneae TaxID=1620701 RepID=UPI003D6F710A
MTSTVATQNNRFIANGVILRGKISEQYAEILTPEALDFLAMLQRRFGTERLRLLELRETIQQQLDQGWLPDFSSETVEIRDRDWQITAIPSDLQDRRVEITGSTDRKMVINALNSGTNAFMADFEDANSPTWDNMISGQVNLRDAVAHTIEFYDPSIDKIYQLKPNPAVLIVRPRGWHLLESHVLVDDQPMSASLFDFGLYFFHNARQLIANGSGPYFYLPKLENRHEAALWNQVFIAAQEALNLPIGTIKVTVLIETILAAFEMDEILYALRDHIVALNCGRWDYIFSWIKKFHHRPDFCLPDRDQVTMTSHFLRSYSLLTIQTCHRRGAMAMGGMAAQIPIRADPVANAAALDKVRADKLREVQDGHDGTWVAHPALVPIAREVFDQHMPGLNQVSVVRDDLHITAQDLLTLPTGSKTEQGLQQNICVGILYLTYWLSGSGCVPLFNLMEDAATAEICRAQVWQWLHHRVVLVDGRTVDRSLFQSVLAEAIQSAKVVLKSRSHLVTSHDLHMSFYRAIDLFVQLVTAERFESFLTLPAYQQLVDL